MRLEDRGMRRREFQRLIRTQLTCRRVALLGFSGIAGLMKILKTSGTWVINSACGPATVAAPGYRWLQLAPDSGEWWLTAMYDEHGNVVQYYFDVVRDIYIAHDGEPRFHDLFLDIILTADGTLILMDRDELDAARAEGIIDSTLYNRALSTADGLLYRLEGNEPALRSFCVEILNMIERAETEAQK